MKKKYIEYNAGDKVAVIVDGNVFRVGIISEFIGDIAVVETPVSIVKCSVLHLKHYEEMENSETEIKQGYELGKKNMSERKEPEKPITFHYPEPKNDFSEPGTFFWNDEF